MLKIKTTDDTSVSKDVEEWEISYISATKILENNFLKS